LPDIFGRFKTMGAGEKIQKQFIAVILAEVVRHAVACGNLRPHKVKESVIHVK